MNVVIDKTWFSCQGVAIGLIAYKNDMQNQLNRIENSDDEIKKLEENLEIQRQKMQKLALDLSEARKEISIKFEKDLVDLLKSVGMKNASFAIEFKRIESEKGMICISENSSWIPELAGSTFTP